MAAYAQTKPLPANPCCAAWKLECDKMKRMKHAYKDTVDVLKNALEKAQAEISNLQKKQQEEAVKTCADKEAREREATARISSEKEAAVRASLEKEAAARASLEKEVSDLKSEISSLQQRLDQNLREKNDEMMLLQGQVSKGEKEIGQLKDLLQKEKLKAGKAEEERKKICEKLKQTKAQQIVSKKKKDVKGHLEKLLENEMGAAEAERKKVESEKKKADQYLIELEALKADAEKTSSKLAAMKSSFENVSNQLKLEKQKTLKEEKRADMESAKAMDQKKLVGSLSKQLEEVKASNELLEKETELQISISKAKNAEDLANLQEQTRLLEVNKKTAMEWKSRADDLAQQLEEARFMTKDLQKQLEELSSSKKSLEVQISSTLHKDRQREDLEMLRKELKFERKRVKHAKQLAKLEKVRREVLVDEMSRLKLEFVHSLNRLNLLDGCFSIEGEGTDDLLGKGDSRRKPLRSNKLSQEKKNLISGNKTSDARYNVVAISDCQKQTQSVPAKLTSKSGRELSESVSVRGLTGKKTILCNHVS